MVSREDDIRPRGLFVQLTLATNRIQVDNKSVTIELGFTPSNPSPSLSRELVANQHYGSVVLSLATLPIECRPF